ncbi:hypothetical protein TNCV_3427161 [Trichonephila clavipes]|nr:hypothetical protein TNCV_3427161 [Trichonephila clavipes]
MKCMYFGEKTGDQPTQRDKPSNFDEKTENIPTQRDKPSHLGEKTEDMPTQRDKPSHLGVKTTIGEFNLYYSNLGVFNTLMMSCETIPIDWCMS